MAIEGPVRELPLSDLLQLLFLSRRTGNLIVRDEGGVEEVVLELDGGSIVGATGTSADIRLGNLLVASGRATEGQIERAVGELGREPRRRLGEALVELGEVRPAEIRRHLRLQVEEVVFDVLRWKDGHLRFEETPPRPAGMIEVRLPTDMLLMDAVRRLDEWAEVTGVTHDADPIPRLALPASGSGGRLALQPLEWEVLTKVDGASSLRTIARSLGKQELDVARAIYALVSVGLIEIGGRSSAAAASADGDPLADEIGAVEAALAEGRVGEAERRVHELLAQKPTLSILHVLRGRLRSRRREWEAAVRSFERAIEIDPLLPAAYFHLGRAAAHTGDLARARTALGTYLRLQDESSRRRRAAESMSAGLEQLLAGLEAGVE
jgi:hypothetical protein